MIALLLDPPWNRRPAYRRPVRRPSPFWRDAVSPGARREALLALLLGLLGAAVLSDLAVWLGL